MTLTDEYQHIAHLTLAGIDVNGLINLFTALEARDGEDVATVRGWIMDELESRDDDAYEEWLGTPNMTIADLRNAYGHHLQ